MNALSRILYSALVLLLCFAAPHRALACLWDYDTLAMERARFPEALELITGKFLRHSPEFYQWRIEDRLRRIEDHATSAALYDDLAVAYDKTGDHAKAVETILRKEAFAPGLYESLANHGTFLIHSGKLREGNDLIGQAIELNPDAHFGREAYQRLLVEYVLENQVEGKSVLPLMKNPVATERVPDVRHVPDSFGFASFVQNQSGVGSKHPNAADLDAALKGILGIMHFGDFRSPVLLESLGNILRARNGRDAKQLAARAFLKASYEVQDDGAKRSYRELALSALNMQVLGGHDGEAATLEILEKDFLRELQEADAWFEGVRRNEIEWIARGLNADAEFDRTYRDPPTVETWHPYNIKMLNRFGFRNSALLLAAVTILPVLILVGRDSLARRRKDGPPAEG